MDAATSYLCEFSSALYNYRRESFLCDVFITTADGEVPAHSIILSSASAKLRVAFARCAKLKLSHVFKLYMMEFTMADVEILLQFIYTGSIELSECIRSDYLSTIVTAGQKLGLDVSKLAGCMGVLLSLSDDSALFTSPIAVSDDDLCVEVVQRGAVPMTGQQKVTPIEVIKVVSKVRSSAELNNLDHRYTQDATHKKSPQYQTNSPIDTFAGYQQIGKSDTDNLSNIPANNLHMCDETITTKSSEDDTSRCVDQFQAPSSYAIFAILPYEDGDRQWQDHDEIINPAVVIDGTCKVEYVSNPQMTLIDHEDEIVELEGVELEGVGFVESLGMETPVGQVKMEQMRVEGELLSDQLVTDNNLLHAELSHKNLLMSGGQGGGAERRRGVKKMAGRCEVKLKVIHMCNLCCRCFKTAPEYTEHYRSHTGEKPFVCDVCGRAFSRSYSATEHRRLHTGEKPYQCDTCGKRFVTAGDLGKHQFVHTGIKPYKCDLCGKEMSTGRENADHRRIHAGENVCPICGKSFTRLHNMKEHINGTHQGVKSHACPYCDKTFAFSTSLRYHKRLHMADKASRCEQCGKIFSRAVELARHVATHHAALFSEIRSSSATVEVPVS